LAESWAFAGLTAELLLQSVEDIIRVFPAWPKEQDAKFVNLRAQGGFLVSAEQRDGEVQEVTVNCTASGRMRLLNPWPRTTVDRGGKLESCVADARGVITLDTHSGEILGFKKAP
jgi:hypothetical protein